MKIKPSKIRLDASTICQLDCITCKTAKGIVGEMLGSQTLEFANFKKIIDANPCIRQVELSSNGEIFLNRGLLEIMKYAYEKKIALSAYTGVNFNTVSDEVLEGLVKYQFIALTCSIDGASNETYKMYRRGGDFNRVIAHIQKINEWKDRYRSKLPKLRWQFIIFGHNEHEIFKAKLMAAKLHMEFYPKIPCGDFSPIHNKKEVKRVAELSATNRFEYRKEYGKVYHTEEVCSEMWLAPQINTDGRVLGCSMNIWGDYGNAFQEDLLKILNSEKMNYARNMLLHKVEERKDIPCVHCPWYQEMKMTNCWLFSRKKV